MLTSAPRQVRQQWFSAGIFLISPAVSGEKQFIAGCSSVKDRKTEGMV